MDALEAGWSCGGGGGATPPKATTLRASPAQHLDLGGPAARKPFLVLVFGGARAWPVLLSGAGLYALQIGRIAKGQDARRYTRADALLWGASCVLSQLPMALGALQFTRSRLLGRRTRLIEYK